MKVGSGSTSAYKSPVHGNSAGGSGEIRRAEVMTDLFNNQLPEAEAKGNVKLRLSMTSRRLSQELKRDVGLFLNDNKEIAENVNAIRLPDGAPDGQGLLVRKTTVYLQWLRIRESVDPSAWEAPTEAEAPYLAIHEQGKDQEIKDLYRMYDDKREAAKQARAKSAPSYYYQAFPEAYSFN